VGFAKIVSRYRGHQPRVGGSELADSVYYAPRLVLKHRPRLVVLYAGDNDIAAGKSPEQVAGDFRDFVSVIRHDQPDTPILFLSIKPSLWRWKLWPKMELANSQIKSYCRNQKRVTLVDVAQPMLGKNGKPRPELFALDGLHLNAQGYAVWAAVLTPYLK
jgi:lysophospholipase L1-like esterase